MQLSDWSFMKKLCGLYTGRLRAEKDNRPESNKSNKGQDQQCDLRAGVTINWSPQN